MKNEKKDPAKKVQQKPNKDSEIQPHNVPLEFPEENPIEPEIEEPGNVPIITDYEKIAV